MRVKNYYFYAFLCFFAINNLQTQVSGNVFRDFNANGVKDNTATLNEVVASCITVTATPTSGTVQTGVV